MKFCVFLWMVLLHCVAVKSLGIEQFWTDDYKIFENVYGKTSDKEIYGDTLPPPVKQGLKRETTKKEQHYDKDAFDISDAPTVKKPAISTQNFVKYTDFKPISHVTDPETYNYLKQLQKYEKDAKFEAPISGFTPLNTYKSIKDIIESDKDSKTSAAVSKSKVIAKPNKFRNDGFKSKCVSGRCKQRPTVRGARPYVARIKHRIVKY